MNKKIMCSIMLLVSIIGMFFVIKPNEVLATSFEKLVEVEIDDIYFTRRDDNGKYASNKFTEYYMNGKDVFCIEPGIPVETLDYSGDGGFINSPYDEATNKYIELVGHYGYSYPGHQTTRFRMATQALIWERTGNEIVEYWTQRYGNGSFIDISHERNIILDLVNKHYLKPSFNSETISTSLGETTTLIDSNNVLSNYEVYTSNGATTNINGNELSITPTQIGNIEVFLIKKHYDNATTIVYKGTDIKSQIMGYFRFSDPVITNVKLNVVGGKVSINKLDVDTQKNTPQGSEATLEGAIYGVYDLTGKLIVELNTDNEAKAQTGEILNIGSYYIQEIRASEGYLLDTNKYFFEINTENQSPSIKVYEQIIKRDIEINKFYANGETGMLKPESGIVFEVYNNKDEYITKFTTDENGYAKVNLVYGTYTIKQKTTTEGHEFVKDFKVVINNDSPDTIKYSLSNAPITAKLKLEKVDSESGKVISYAGVEFKIKNLETNEYVKQIVSYPNKEEVSIFKTNENGEFTTPYPLVAGTYQIEEISSPNGYLLTGNHIIFTIDENSKLLEDNFGKYIEVIFKNDKIKGQVTINKVGEIPSFENNEIEYSNKPLEGVVFGIYANEDIVSLDGVTHYKKDELVTKVTTDKVGTAINENMILGKYYIQEISTIDNYVLDKTKYEFELTEEDNKTSIVYENIKLENKYKKGELEFTKTDFVTGDIIPNTIIEIYNADDELLFTKITDEDGKVIIKELPVGKYYIIEKEAVTGYLITEEIVEFEIKENGEIVKAEMTNKPIVGKLEFTKVDFSTSEALPNTKIEIYNINDELIFEGKTDENGMIVIDELRYGKYYILEKEAPEGYILNTERMYFEILENGEVVKATMTNEQIVIEVPDTGINELPLKLIIGSSIVICGVGVVAHGYKKSKKKK